MTGTLDTHRRLSDTDRPPGAEPCRSLLPPACSSDCHSCGQRSIRRRHQGHDLGRVLQRVQGARPRVRKGDRPHARHHARAFARRFTGSDPDAPRARRARGRPDHGRTRHRYPGDARPDPPRQPDAARGVVHRHGGARGPAQAGHQHGRGAAQDAARREIHRLFGLSSSGTYLSTVGFKKLGVADEIAGRTRKVRGPPSGEPVAAVVARGEAEDRLPAGRRADPCAGDGLRRHGAGRDSAADLISSARCRRVRNSRRPRLRCCAFLSSAEAAAVITKSGLKPLAAR